MLHDVTGQPLSGVQIAFSTDQRSCIGKEHEGPIATFTTNTQGEYSGKVRVPRGQTLRAYAHKPGFVSRRLRSFHSALNWAIRLTPGIPLRVLLHRADDEDISTAWVSLKLVLKPGQSQATGTSLHIPHFVEGPGPHTFWVVGNRAEFRVRSHLGLQGRVDRPLPSSEVTEIELLDRPKIAGRVVDETGKGVSGVIVSSGYSNENGEFYVFAPSQPVERRWILQPRHPDYLRTAKVYEPGDLPDFISITLPAARLLRVQVMNPDGAYPRIGRIEIGEENHKLYQDENTLRSLALPPESTRGVLHVAGCEPIEVSWPEGSGDWDLGQLSATWAPSQAIEVVSETGEPVSGARVSVWCREPQKRLYTNTDEAGFGILRGLRPGHWEVSVTAAEHEILETTMDFPNEALPRQRFVLKRAGKITFELHYPDGQSVRQANVRILSNNRPYRAYWNSREDRWEVPFLPLNSPLELRVRIPDQLPILQTLAPLESTEPRSLGLLKPERGLNVTGTVVDDRGVPIPEVSLYLEGEGMHRHGSSDSSGRFNLKHLAPGNYSLSASTMNHHREEQHFGLEEGKATDLDYQLVRMVGHRVQVRFDDGRPVSEVSVRMRSAGARSRGKYLRDSNGLVEIPPPTWTPFELVVRCGWREEQVFRYESLDDVPEQLFLPAGRQLKVSLKLPAGFVLPSYLSLLRPRPGHFPWEEVASASLEGGSYYYDDLPPDLDSVSIRQFSLPIPTPQQIDRSSPAGVQAMHFAIEPHTVAHVISVRDARGAPVEDARVALSNHDVGFVEARTNEQGIASLAFDCEVHVLRIDTEGHPGVRITPGDEALRTRRYDIALRALCSLELKIETHEGFLIAGARVSISGRGFSGFSKTNSSGVAYLDRLCHGDARVCVSTDTGTVSEFVVNLPVPGDSLTHRLLRPTRVHGTVRVNGELMSEGGISVSFPDPAPGVVPWNQLEVLPDGTFFGVVYGSGLAWISYGTPYDYATRRSRGPTHTREVVISDGKSIDLELSTHTIRGQVLDVAGQPLPDYWLWVTSSPGMRWTTDQNGRFEVQVAAGEVRIFRPGAEDSTSLLWDQQLTVNESKELTLQTVPTYSVRVRLAGDPFDSCSARVVGNREATLTTIKNDHDFVLCVPSGKHTIRLVATRHTRVGGNTLFPQEHYAEFSVQVPYEGPTIEVEPLPKPTD